MSSGQQSVGHPVDVASGMFYTSHRDLIIPGKVDLVWERFYSTALLGVPPAALGPGWTNRYFASLTHVEGEYRFVQPDGGIDIFADPEGKVDQGEVVRNLGTFQELVKRNYRYIVTTWSVGTGDVVCYVFKQGPEGQAWPLESIEDVTGQGLDLLRDGAGRLTGIQQRLEKRRLRLDYVTGNRIGTISLVVPGERSSPLVRYDYDTEGRLHAAYDALGHADRYHYDAEGRMTREIGKDGGVYTFQYDEKGRCIRAAGFDDYDAKTLRFLDHLGWTEVTDSLGYLTRFEWLPTGQVVKEIDPLGGLQETSYDEYNRIVARTDPNGATSSFDYDEQGNLCSIVDSLGNTSLITYNDAHLPLTLTDPDGNQWRCSYDGENKLVRAEDPLGESMRFAYDNHGNLVHVIDSRGASKRQVFSDDGILQEATDWEGNTTRYTFDSLGRVTETDPAGYRSTYQYDLVGNLLEITYPGGSKVRCAYDGAGNLTQVTDANGYTTTYRYGPCHRLLERVDRLGRTVNYRWGSEPNRLEEVINEKGESYRFFYDKAGKITREVGFDGTEVAFEYDPAGNCIAKIKGPGERISYQRDAAGNVIEEVLPDGTVTHFAYDNLSRLVAALNQDSVLKYERDALGRVVKEYQGDVLIERQYDSVGNIVSMHTSHGHEVAYTYDGNGLPLGLTTKNQAAFQFAYTARGEEVSRFLPGNIRMEKKYGPEGQLIDQHVRNANGMPPSDSFDRTARADTIIHRAFRYDAAGALASVEDARWGDQTFTYDPAERLILATNSPGSSEQFTYDRLNNLTSVGHNGRETTFDYAPSSRLIRRGNTRYEYDDYGRLICKTEDVEGGGSAEWSYTWDVKDQLRSMRMPDGTLWSYSYDALGRRIAKEGPGKSIRYVWDQEAVMHQVEDDRLAATWISNPFTLEPLCTIQGDALYAVITDHLRTPRELVDASGTIVWSAFYSSWGALEALHANGVECPIRFPGQWYDEESGLHYNRFRYYDPQAGRYLSGDPLLLLGGLNPYAYARNPINWADPLGLFPVPRVGEGADVQEVPMTDLNPLHNVPRRGVDPANIDNITNNISNNGYDVSQPISATRLDNGDLIITGGHHRVEAMRRLGETTVPVRIREGANTDPVFLAKMLGIGRITGLYPNTIRPPLTVFQRIRVFFYLVGWRIQNRDQVRCRR